MVKHLVRHPTTIAVVALLLLCLSTLVTYHRTHTTVSLVDVPTAYAQAFLSEREIFNKVYNLAANRLQTDAWAQPTQPFLTVEEILNKVYDPAGQFLRTSGGGGGGTSQAWADITSGTNVNTLTMGTGGTLTTSGTGVINASQFKGNTVIPVADGGTGLTSAADDTIPVGNGTIYQLKALPNCTDVTGQHLNYTAATNTFSCGTTGTGGANPPFDTITTGTNPNTLTMGNGGVFTTTGTGIVNANQFKGNSTIATADGGTGLSTAVDDAIIVGNGTIWQSKAIPTCTDVTGNHLNYNAATNTFSCGTTSSTGAPAFNTIGSGTNTTAAMVVGSGATLTPTGTGTINATQFKGNTVVPVADGGTGLTSATDDTIPVGNGTVYQLKTLPDCTDVTGQHLNYTAATNTFSCGTAASPPAAVAFDALTTGSNTTAVMTVATGAQLTFSGTGTINASQFKGLDVIPAINGGTGLQSPVDDNVMVGNGTVWQAKAIPDCDDVTGNHLNYDTTTNAFICGNSGGVGGGGSFSALTSGTNTTAAMVLGSGASLDVTGTGTNKATHLGGLVATDYATLAGNQTLLSTFVKPLIVTQTITANAFSINVATTRIAVVPALSAGVTVSAPTTSGGFPYDGQEVIILFLPSAAPQSITWNAIWSPLGGLALPTSVLGDNTTFSWVKFAYVASVTKYVMVATTLGTEPGITTLTSSTTYTCPHLTSRKCKMTMTGTAGTVTLAIPSGGTPADGKQLVFWIKCTNLQTLTLTTGAGGFIESPNVPITGLTCPAAGASYTAIGAEYDSGLDRWQVVATN